MWYLVQSRLCPFYDKCVTTYISEGVDSKPPGTMQLDNVELLTLMSASMAEFFFLSSANAADAGFLLAASSIYSSGGGIYCI